VSREHTWDAAAQLQAEMFSEAAKLGGLEMQVSKAQTGPAMVVNYSIS
jgi:hypothetical protein